MSSARIALLAFAPLLSAGIAPAIPSQRSASAPSANGRNGAGRKELDNRATQHLIQLVDGSPEYRLFIGKYHLNLEQYDAALAEFPRAAEADPKLPFVHFNLGLTYRKKQDFPRACDEFLKDAAVEPSLALDYDELGDVYWRMPDDRNAETCYREALRRDRGGQLLLHMGR